MSTTFKYQAKDASGRTINGTMTAASQNDVVADLRRRALTPVQIKASSAGLMSGINVKKLSKVKRASVKKGELEVFTRQLSTMLGAGIPMLEALEILAEQAETPGFAFCLNRVVEDIRSGLDLSKSMERIQTDL